LLSCEIPFILWWSRNPLAEFAFSVRWKYNATYLLLQCSLTATAIHDSLLCVVLFVSFFRCFGMMYGIGNPVLLPLLFLVSKINICGVRIP